jgi:sigma-B regulation protein RsbU (phosphoserine phosphatase)
MLRSWNRTLQQRADIRAVADDVAELQLAYSDQETGLRGFQLEGEASYLEPYREGIAAEQTVTVRLLATSDAIDGLDESVRSAVDRGEAWRRQVAVPTIEGADIPAAEAKAAFDDVRAALDALDGLVNAELIDLDEAEREVRRNAFGIILASTFVAIAGTALAASLFRRWVIAPLGQISKAARELADDEAYPIPTFEAPELDDVSTAIGSLQRSLRSARDEAIANYDALEQSAVLAIQVRSELADELGDLPDGWKIKTLLRPAEGLVAGDCFDIGLLDRHRMYVVLIDVTGHGAAAALNALTAKSHLRAALRNRRSPGAAIEWLSQEMLKDDDSNMLTASVLVIDLATGRIRHANAGHPPVLMTNGDEVVAVEQPGPLVGAFEATWPTAEVDLPEGWTILLHTDGITEMLGDDRQRFGDERLHGCLSATEPVELLTNIERAVDDFRAGPQTDDVTAIAIHRIAEHPEAEVGADPSADVDEPTDGHADVSDPTAGGIVSA